MNLNSTKKVYLIDDEEDFCQAFRDAIASRLPELEVHYALSTEAASKDSHFEDCSLVFIDLRMPQQTGDEFLRELEKKKKFEGKRFIVVSGIVRCETAIPVGERKETVAVLPKPLDFEKVITQIVEHFAEAPVE